MLEEFKIRATERKNKLDIVLNGYFLMSEVELALHMIKRESKKLNTGFEVIADIRNFHTPSNSQEVIISRIKKALRLLGAGKVSYRRSGNYSQMFRSMELNYIPVNAVGFYS